MQQQLLKTIGKQAQSLLGRLAAGRELWARRERSWGRAAREAWARRETPREAWRRHAGAELRHKYHLNTICNNVASFVLQDIIVTARSLWFTK